MLAIVVGGSGGIGSALVTQLRQQPDITAVIASYFQSDVADLSISVTPSEPPQDSELAPLYSCQLDATDEASVKNFADFAARYVDHARPIKYLINCIGVLQTPELQPEKSIRNVDPHNLQQAISINSLPTLLLAKYLGPLLKSNTPCLFTTVSARVGSISDNRLGGWYSYRMSKAALNQALKCLAIEWQRAATNVIVVALHPGTTATALSEPFQANVPAGKLFTPAKTAGLLLQVLNSLQHSDSGKFLAYDGTEIGW